MATTKSVRKARVVIIGAGAAGIAAATHLLENGFKKVLILEAEDRIGGRINTVPFADNFVDLGAQWCHGEKLNAVYDLVNDKNVLESTGTIYDDYVCVRSNQDVVPSEEANMLKDLVNNTLTLRKEGLVDYNGSLGDYLTTTFWRQFDEINDGKIDRTVAREFFENYKKFESSVEAADNVFDVSGKGHLEYWLCEGELLLNWKDTGFKTFLRMLMKSKQGEPDDLGILRKRVLFNKRVERIEWDRIKEGKENEILLKCCDGDFIEADHVLCTMSLGVLKENYKTMFWPELPNSKCRAIEGLELGTVNKFFLEFAEPFGPSEWSGFCFLWREEDLAELRSSDDFWLESVFGFYRVPYQPRVIEGWIIGPQGRHMETLTESAVLKGLMDLFRKFFSFPVPEPTNFLRTSWFSNHNFRGSYSFRAMYTEQLDTGAWDLSIPLHDRQAKPVVQFAGEATHLHYYSTVHGAVESGRREAQRLSSYYDRRGAQL